MVATTATTNSRPLRLKGWAWDGLALLYFIAVSFLLLWPLSGNFITSSVSEGDSLTQMWSVAWVVHALFNDPGNLFNANLFYPYPNTMAFSDATIAQAFQAMPILGLTGNLVLAYNILTWFSFALSGWGMYLLVKDLTGSRAGGLLAGMIFAFAPYRIGRISQLNLLSTQWLPFCFLFVRILFRRDLEGRLFKQAIRQDWGITAAFAFFFILNALSTFYYFFYLLPLLAIYFIFVYATKRKLPGLALLLKLAAAALVAGLIIWPVASHYLQVAADQGAERTATEVERFSANYRFYLAVPDNNLFWGNELKRMGGTGGERRLFPGATGLLFATIGLVGPWWLFFRRRKPLPGNVWWAERWLWLLLGFFALIMSFGLVLRVKGFEIPLPYGLFRNFVPGWNGLRAAVRYGLFVTMAVAVLAGFGVAFVMPYLQKGWQKLSEVRLKGRNLNMLAAGLGVFVLLVPAFLECRTEFGYTRPDVLTKPPEVYRWLAEPANAGPLIELPLPVDVRNGPSTRDFYSTLNWQPLVGGINAYVPLVFDDLQKQTVNFPNKDAINLLQGIGVRWVVYHIDDENTPLSAADFAKIEPRLNATPELKLVKEYPQDKIKVYELASNPWLVNMVKSLPEGADVIVSDYRLTQVTSIELAATLLQRYGHKIYGNDRAGYRFLNLAPTGRPVTYGLLSDQENPSPYGFAADDEIWGANGLKLYKRSNPPAAVYDVARDPKLRDVARLSGPLELEINQNELKFNGKSVGGGTNLSGQTGVISLSLGSTVTQTVKLAVPGKSENTLTLAPGLNIWKSAPLPVGAKIRLEPESGHQIILSRAELLSGASTENLTVQPNKPALLTTESRQENGKFVSSFDILAPALDPANPGKYTLTLDVYKRPWGSHPTGHFGNWSIALTGEDKSHKVEFSFDPVQRDTKVTVDGKLVDVGGEVFRPGDGDWAVFIALWRSDPQNPKADTQVGVARLYEFSLVEGKIEDVNLLPGRPLIFQPPLKK